MKNGLNYVSLESKKKLFNLFALCNMFFLTSPLSITIFSIDANKQKRGISFFFVNVTHCHYICLNCTWNLVSPQDDDDAAPARSNSRQPT